MTTVSPPSPSPVASPCTSFRPPPAPRLSSSSSSSSRPYSPRPSPRPYPGAGRGASPPRRAAVHAPSASPRQARRERPPRVADPGAPPSPAVGRPLAPPPPPPPPRPHRYVDSGTQYSPDGYPPTAGPRYAKVAPAVAVGGYAGSPRAAAGAAEAAERDTARKRKERSAEPPPPPVTSGAASVQDPVPPTVPSEPQLRTDPTAPAPAPMPAPQPVTRRSETRTADLPRRGAADPAHPEPQEARSTLAAPSSSSASASAKRARPAPGTVKIMPRAYETCHPRDLGVLIANMLMELIRLNDRIPLRDGRLTRFHSRAPPGISVADYLQRLIQHATLSPPILLSMVFYIDRLCALYSAFTINSLTVHRFLITAATVAAKGLSDSFWTNPTYARIGGIPVSELATLELEFLQRVQWKIVPKPEVLVGYYESLIDRFEGWELERSASESSSLLDESERSGGDGDGDGDEDQSMTDDPT